MGISVLIASTLRNSITTPASISINKALGDASTCQVTLKDPTGAVIPGAGNILEIQDQNSDVQFFGSINDCEVSKIGNFVGAESLISATDLNYSAIRRSAGAYSWVGKTVLEIVTDIVANSLSGDLTDITLVETGPVIPSFFTDYPSVKDAFDQLAELAGMRWYIDELNKLRFFTPSAATAPFSIVDGTNISGLSIRETREDYCNTVVARVGNALLDPATEDFTGDGATTSFELTKPVGSAPSVLVDGSPQTVGIAGVDTGFDWYWNQGSVEIRQDSGGVVLTGANTLSVTYVGVDQLFVFSQNAAEVSARATAEGNSGIYQKFLEIDGYRSRSDAQAIADAFVDRYSALTYVASVVANDQREPGILALRPGDVMSITIPGYGTTGDFLCRKINLTHREGVNSQDEFQWKARIDLVKGPIVRNFADMFKARGGGSGSVTGVSGAPISSGSGVFTETVELAANTTHTSAYAATPGAKLSVWVKSLSGYTITFDASQFVVYNDSIGPLDGSWSEFTFTGRSDGKWWQGPVVTGIEPV